MLDEIADDLNKPLNARSPLLPHALPPLPAAGNATVAASAHTAQAAAATAVAYRQAPSPAVRMAASHAPLASAADLTASALLLAQGADKAHFPFSGVAPMERRGARLRRALLSATHAAPGGGTERLVLSVADAGRAFKEQVAPSVQGGWAGAPDALVAALQALSADAVSGLVPCRFAAFDAAACGGRGSLYVARPLYPRGSLSEKLARAPGRPVPDGELLAVAAQVCSALRRLRERRVPYAAHLHAGNVLLGEDHAVVLNDVENALMALPPRPGAAAALAAARAPGGRRGRRMAPDVAALGLLVFHMATGEAACAESVHGGGWPAPPPASPVATALLRAVFGSGGSDGVHIPPTARGLEGVAAAIDALAAAVGAAGAIADATAATEALAAATPRARSAADGGHDDEEAAHMESSPDSACSELPLTPRTPPPLAAAALPAASEPAIRSLIRSARHAATRRAIEGDSPYQLLAPSHDPMAASPALAMLVRAPDALNAPADGGEAPDGATEGGAVGASAVAMPTLVAAMVRPAPASARRPAGAPPATPFSSSMVPGRPDFSDVPLTPAPAPAELAPTSPAEQPGRSSAPPPPPPPPPPR